MKTTTFVQSQLTENKSYDSYLTAIRGAIRGLYREQLSLFEFVDNMVSVVEHNLIMAWNDGARDCGIKPDELSQVELLARDRYITNQFRYILPLGKAVQLDRNKVRISEALLRANMWANRWWEAFNRARVLICGDAKYMWVVGQAEHCTTCLKLNGRVMRASKWRELDIWPRDTRPGKLDCRGFNCQCSLVKTDAQLTRGPLPKLP